MILSEAVDMFLFHCRYERNLRKKTINAYEIDLHQFSEHASDNVTIEVETMEKETIRSFLNFLGDRFKPRTIKRKVATLKAFFTYLEFEDIVNSNPLRKMKIRIRTGKELPKTVGIDVIRKLLRYVYLQRNQLEECCCRPKRLKANRDIVTIELLFASGMRVSELSNLKWRDIDTKNGTIRIMGKGEKERIIPICSDDVLRALSDYRKCCPNSIKDSDYLLINRLGKQMSDQSIRTAIRRLAKAVGVEVRLTPHMFRHTTATLLRKNGMDVHDIQHLLGHSSIQTTMIYTHVDASAHRREIRKRHPRKLITV